MRVQAPFVENLQSKSSEDEYDHTTKAKDKPCLPSILGNMASSSSNHPPPVASIGTTLEDAAANAAAPPQNLLQAQPLASDSTVTAKPHIPSVSASAVLGESASMPAGSIECRGHNFDDDE